MSWAAEKGAVGRAFLVALTPLDRRPPPSVPEDAQAEVAVARKDVQVAASSLSRVAMPHGLIADREHTPEVVAALVDEPPDLEDPLMLSLTTRSPGVVVGEIR